MRVITGSARGRKLCTPEGLDTRPTSDMTKGAVFSILQTIVENSDFLDLFAGSGQMGVEALSRGARSATFIDSNPKAIAAVKENLKACGLMEKSRVALMDSVSYIQNCSARFDIIFLDPPYNKGLISAVLPHCAKCLKEEGIILCETEKKEILPQTAGDLELVKEYRYGKAKISTYRRKSDIQ
ncbi:MAG: 16S rRNA (guanine(966)-N(2))-methyltransferase RsmD [Negativibacillus sp.]